MSTTLPAVPEREDRRGAPAGQFGNPAFVPTEEQRARVRTLAKTIKADTPVGRKWLASQMGISVNTLDRHFEDDVIAGRAELNASLGATMVGVAMGTIKDVDPVRMRAIEFTLSRLCNWTTKVTIGTDTGRPIETVDLSKMTPAALREYGRQAAIQMGLDPDEAVGPPLED